MRTRHTPSIVSVAAAWSDIGFAALLVAMLGVGACGGRQHPVTQVDAGEHAGNPASAVTAAADMLQFDNQATEYVDVYLVGGQVQWRLGRVPPGMRATLRVPESAIEWTAEFVRLVVIPGSRLSALAAREPRAIIAIERPVSEVLSECWTLRQSAGTVLQLQATQPGRSK